MQANIRRTISLFQKDLEQYFHQRILDIVIYGSVIRGGFTKEKSDIDFIVFLHDELTDIDMQTIWKLHTMYRSRKNLSSLLEGRYVGLKDNKFINGYYVGTNPKGWKPLSNIGFDNLESAMILDSYESVFKTSILSEVLKFDWRQIELEIIKQIDDFINNPLLETDNKYMDYALITASRSLYTTIEKGFISKSNVIMWIELNFMKLDFDNPKDSLLKMKNIINRMTTS